MTLVRSELAVMNLDFEMKSLHNDNRSRAERDLNWHWIGVNKLYFQAYIHG